MSTSLSGKTALVTGASRGIGRATALRLARDGAFVIVHYGSSKAAADAVVAEIRKNGGDAVAIGADLADPKGPDRLAADVRNAIASAGRKALDILVNNAGVAEFMTNEGTSIEAFDRIFAINARAPFRLTTLLRNDLAEGGRVIFLTTSATRFYFPNLTAYSASKGAVDVMIRNFAADFGPKGVRVTGVAPGAIETDMASFLSAEEGRNQIKSVQALQDIGQPEDIANAIAFLAGPDGRWVTGEILTVSGGTKL